jgi:DNA-binding NarL/FixJ family response regulator
LLQNLSDKVKLCYERAAEARERADETLDPEAKTDFLNVESRWLLLARSYELGERLDDITRENSRRAKLARAFEAHALLQASGAVIAVQAISSHPLLIRAVEEILAEEKECLVLPSVSNEAEATSQPDVPRLFLLDACSLHTNLGALAERCRSRLPHSKFLALLPPNNRDSVDKLQLFHWGIEGLVELSETWRTELPQAIRCILSGQYWMPSTVLTAFARYVQAVERARLQPGHSLTAREGQVLQLLMRRLTNKEIARSLVISERTVKFHVAHILAKLGVKNRCDLLPQIRTSSR